MRNLHKKNKIISSKGGWLVAAKIAESTRKTAVSPTCCHLYDYCSNNPMRYTDPDGNAILIEFRYKSEKRSIHKTYIWDNKNNCFRTRFTRQVVKNNTFVTDITACIVYLKGSNHANEIIDALNGNGKTTIVNNKGFSRVDYSDNGTVTILFDSNQWLDLKDCWKSKNSTALNLGHEFVHAYDHVIEGTYESDLKNKNVPENFQDLAEMNAVKNTNKMAVELGEAIRTDYTTARSEKRDENSKFVTDFVNNQWRW